MTLDPEPVLTVIWLLVYPTTIPLYLGFKFFLADWHNKWKFRREAANHGHHKTRTFILTSGLIANMKSLPRKKSTKAQIT